MVTVAVVTPFTHVYHKLVRSPPVSSSTQWLVTMVVSMVAMVALVAVAVMVAMLCLDMVVLSRCSLWVASWLPWLRVRMRGGLCRKL